MTSYAWLHEVPAAQEKKPGSDECLTDVQGYLVSYKVGGSKSVQSTSPNVDYLYMCLFVAFNNV